MLILLSIYNIGCHEQPQRWCSPILFTEEYCLLSGLILVLGAYIALLWIEALYTRSGSRPETTLVTWNWD